MRAVEQVLTDMTPGVMLFGSMGPLALANGGNTRTIDAR
jgi:hypothetical protein